MIKTLLIMAAVACTSAQAATFASMPNKAGGEIRLMTDHCKGNTTALLAYATEPDGGLDVGCWLPLDDQVLVVWGGGQKRAYPAAAFKPIHPMKPAPAKKKYQYQ